MTKADLIEAVHARVGLSKKESAELVQFVLDEIRQALARGEHVKVSGFGHFMVLARAARVGRNPKTGEEIRIAPRRAVVFRPSPVLRRRIEEGEA